ncbi:hypothetical protein [Streptomyces sp. DHE17-7]|uniref:hypothetical protein n=1 Tax=Streptomyces sp. DHE17-7 TaxID=2759949 RepID=UPI0022EA1E1B|nr:hypothetical protein [Streptomyces sp. DHE17-7]
MIEWVPLGSGPRPVPRPVAAPLVWAGGAPSRAALGPWLAALSTRPWGYGRPGLALALLSLLAALLGVCARFTAAPGTALLCWLSLNGFAIPPAGVLTWTGRRDAFWLACLLSRPPGRITGTRGRLFAPARATYAG